MPSSSIMRARTGRGFVSTTYKELSDGDICVRRNYGDALQHNQLPQNVQPDTMLDCRDNCARPVRTTIGLEGEVHTSNMGHFSQSVLRRKLHSTQQLQVHRAYRAISTVASVNIYCSLLKPMPWTDTLTCLTEEIAGTILGFVPPPFPSSAACPFP